MSLAFRAGLQLGFRHTLALTKGRFFLVALVLSVIWTILFSGIARSASPTSATTVALLGPVFGIAVPLALFAYCQHLGRLKLKETANCTWLLGASPSAFGLGVGLASVLASGGLCLLLGLLSVLLIRTTGDPALIGDLLTTSWVSVLGGTAYACWFTALGATGGRVQGFTFLLLDWMLGSGTAPLALIWPRAHLANLLGAATSLPASAGVSLMGLSLLSLMGLALLVFRISR